LIFGAIALAGKYGIFNITALPAYGKFLDNLSVKRSADTQKATLTNLHELLFKNAPGVLGGCIAVLVYGLNLTAFGLKELIQFLIFNPEGAWKELFPERGMDSWGKLGTFLTSNPGLIFGAIALAGKYLLFNITALPAYGKFFNNLSIERSAEAQKATLENLGELLFKNAPGVLGGCIAALVYGLNLTAVGLKEVVQFLIFNPQGAWRELFPKAEPDSWEKLGTFLTSNPGLIFGAAALAGKYLLFNITALPAYITFLDNLSVKRSAEAQKATLANLHELLFENAPGVLGGCIAALVYGLNLTAFGLKELIQFLIFNPEGAWRKLFPKEEPDSWENIKIFLTSNPGLIFGAIALAGKYTLFNITALPAYRKFFNNLSVERSAEAQKATLENLGELLFKNAPGVLGGCIAALVYGLNLTIFGLKEAVKFLIFNPKAEWGLLFPDGSGENVQFRPFFESNPGLLFAGIAILGKYGIFNVSASKEYGDFIFDRSPTNFAALWSNANPGALMGVIMSLVFVFEWSVRSVIWNPAFAAKDFMFGQEAGLRDIKAVEAGALCAKWPGLVYCILLLSIKYAIVNFSAREEYWNAFTAVGGVKEIGDLFKRSPGVVAMTLFIAIKFFEELGAKILFDPRLIAAYTAFWKNPTLDNAGNLFQAGVIGAAIFAVGRGIEGLRGGLANMLEQNIEEEPSRG
jgi:hypothetical protein